MLELIKSLDLDVLCLQEVGHADFDAFTGLFETAAFSLEVVRSDGHTSGRSGVAVLARRDVRLKPETAELLYGLHQPERGLGVEAVWDRRPLRLLSWHAPNAKQHGRELKEAAYRAVIEHIAGWSISGMRQWTRTSPRTPPTRPRVSPRTFGLHGDSIGISWASPGSMNFSTSTANFYAGQAFSRRFQSKGR